MDIQAPSLRRRLACVAYEILLLLALFFIALFPLAPLLKTLEPALARGATQLYVLALAWAYFAYFWRKGQTLAMKTWRIRMLTRDGAPLTLAQASLRYLLACLNLVLLGVGWWYALRQDDRQFLQDRLAGTVLVRSPATP